MGEFEVAFHGFSMFNESSVVGEGSQLEVRVHGPGNAEIIC